jgi:uncharacterized OB-fold protein
MTFLEKQTDPTSFMHWRGDMQADYLYTSGRAGDKFFKHLKKKDTFLATRCPQCRKVFFPPRLFCEDCFCEIPDKAWIEVPSKGTVRLFTVATIDSHGKKLGTPKVVGLIDIEKTDGAMLGIIKTKDITKDFTGKKVKAVLKPKKKREGTLKDILYFE